VSDRPRPRWWDQVVSWIGELYLVGEQDKMTRPRKRGLDYQGRVEKMNWLDLASLWEEIEKGRTSLWEPGKALEYLIVRGFALSGLDVDYPYEVPPGGEKLEQIDGIVYLDGLAFLLECKDAEEKADIVAFAKLRNQLMRRPDTTMGCLFVAGEFTRPALRLADYSVPHRILLWQGEDVREAMVARDFRSALSKKYRHLCKYGLTDYSPNYRNLEAKQ
jgi:Restriction endonuclease